MHANHKGFIAQALLSF